jgi:hypothetical protein
MIIMALLIRNQDVLATNTAEIADDLASGTLTRGARLCGGPATLVKT